MFEKLFETAPAAVVVTDRQGVIIDVNAQAEELFGYRRDELRGQTLELLAPQLLPAAHTGSQAELCAELCRKWQGAALESRARRKDGTEFPADIVLIPVEEQEQSRMVCAIRDLSERNRTEHALRESEESFRLLVEGVKDCSIFMLDPQGLVRSWNCGAESINGYRADEIIGQHFRCFYTPEDTGRGKPEEHLAAAEAAGQVEDEGWRVRKDGSLFWANVITTALRDEAGHLRGFAKVTRDFTERKKAQDALLLQMTNVLISNLDIRELLSAIGACLGQMMPHAYASLALHDPGSAVLRLLPLDSPYEDQDSMHRESLLPMQGSPEGWVFTSGTPLLLSRLNDDRFSRHITGQMIEAGIKSACFVPLHGRERPLGTLNVARQEENAFTSQDRNLLVQVAKQVAIALDNALAFRRIAALNEKVTQEKRCLQNKLQTEYNFEEIVGESSALRRILRQVETVAPTDATVLLLGETGTGKELIARAIHDLSSRRGHIFVRFNCAAIPTGLLESELFGHEKGAFTGASAQRLGRLDLAHRGTLFLDEVGDIPLELQPKLLRALQEKEFERLGSTETIPVDVRLIAATNRDLSRMVREKEFRSDLYYRLKVFPITVPPLRDRREDIPLLVRYFVQKHAFRMNKRIETIPPEVMEALARWDWPGNVRELGNFLERAVILTRGSILQVPLSELKLPDEVDSLPPVTLGAIEREHILRVLRETHGVIGGPRGAAARLGLNRSTLNSRMRKLKISRQEL